MRERLAGIREHEQSLRQVTVLFMDVVGSSALSRRLDPEDIHTIIDGALARLSALVGAHQGRVLQYAGDSLLAVFGAVEAREDDPERAMRCALAIVREAQQIGAEVRVAAPDGEFDVRVGIHSGPVLLGGGIDDASTIRGITVNIAARMEQTAPVGGVRISHETQRHVRGRFDVSDEPPISVKSPVAGLPNEEGAGSDGLGRRGSVCRKPGPAMRIRQRLVAGRSAIAQARSLRHGAAQVTGLIGDGLTASPWRRRSPCPLHKLDVHPLLGRARIVAKQAQTPQHRSGDKGAPSTEVPRPRHAASSRARNATPCARASAESTGRPPE